MKLLVRLAEQFNTAIMIVTHDDVIIPRFKRLYRLRDGVGHEETGQGLPFPDCKNSYDFTDSLHLRHSFVILLLYNEK